MHKPAFRFRPATVYDARELWAVRQRAQDAAGLCRVPDLFDTWLDAAMPDDFVARVESGHYLVADDPGGFIAGYAALDVTTQEIEVLVDPACVHHGLGHQLLVAIEQRAQELGLLEVRLVSPPGTVGFFRGAGFCEAADTGHGMFAAVGIFMHKLLGARPA